MGEAQPRVAKLDGEVLQLAPAAPVQIRGRLRTGVPTWERV
ncbi:hypothetical protein ACWGDT_18125 [Streptomyces avermitilis]